MKNEAIHSDITKTTEFIWKECFLFQIEHLRVYMYA